MGHESQLRETVYDMLLAWLFIDQILQNFLEIWDYTLDINLEKEIWNLSLESFWKFRCVLHLKFKKKTSWIVSKPIKIKNSTILSRAI